MSKGRFDRKRRGEEWKDQYTPLGGGLDQLSSALAIKPGRVAQSLNFHEVFGKQGYQTKAGYERFDGRSRPSACNYAIQRYDAGTAAIVAGDTVTNTPGSATAIVVSNTISSGTIGAGTAAGYLLLVSLSGEWADNDPIKVGGTLKATASDRTEPGSIGYSGGHQAALRAAREYLRALIQKPAGEGAILGGAVFNLAVYCVRNVVGSKSATLWKSSASGWTSIATGLHPGGHYKFVVDNFTGDPTNTYLYGISGRSRLLRVSTADVLTKADPIFGSEATSTSSNLIATGAKTFTIAQSLRSWIAGDAITAWDAVDVTNYMVGTVTSYNSGTGALVMNVTSIGGSGTKTSWEFGRTDYADKAFLIDAHKNHLMLGYPRGQLQTSNLGDGMTFTTTAALFGIGAELTDIKSLKGEVLAIFTRQKIQLLRGTSSIDWELGTHSRDAGASTGTVQANGGNAMFLDDRGLTTLAGSQNFGDFDQAIFSRDVATLLKQKRPLVTGSRIAKDASQYRLYFSDGVSLRCTLLGGADALTPRDVSFMPVQYPHVPMCTWAGIMDDGSERLFFGTSDGYVMEEDVGTSHDGAAIFAVLRLPFDHCKTPSDIKQYLKMELELECADGATIYFRQIFEYDDGTYDFGALTADVAAVGGQFDVSAFDTFQFDRATTSRVEQPLDGQGRNMALLLFIESDFIRPLNIQGVWTFFAILGKQR